MKDEGALNGVLNLGYQAAGTPGSAIQRYGPRGGYVELDGQRYDIRARIHTPGGYSAHADQQNLLDFVGAMNPLPREVILVHGERGAKLALQAALRDRFAGIGVSIA
jgi:metallo-beta-lactamase family protein